MVAVENRREYEIGRVNVTDRDDRGTGNWEAKYSISNDPQRNFAISTDPATNQGVLTVVQVPATRYTSGGIKAEKLFNIHHPVLGNLRFIFSRKDFDLLAFHPAASGFRSAGQTRAASDS